MSFREHSTGGLICANSRTLPDEGALRFHHIQRLDGMSAGLVVHLGTALSTLT
jgi:hypothetical protein